MDEAQIVNLIEAGLSEIMAPISIHKIYNAAGRVSEDPIQLIRALQRSARHFNYTKFQIVSLERIFLDVGEEADVPCWTVNVLREK